MPVEEPKLEPNFQCPKCKHNFHATFPLLSIPPKDICPNCQSYISKDDNNKKSTCLIC